MTNMVLFSTPNPDSWVERLFSERERLLDAVAKNAFVYGRGAYAVHQNGEMLPISVRFLYKGEEDVR